MHFIYQEFWLKFALREQMNIDGGRVSIANMLIEVAQKFEH